MKYEEQKIHKTAKGEKVRSKSEVIIADLLYMHGIKYEYEKPLIGLDRTTIHPDFTIWDLNNNRFIFIEHLGMMDNEGYKRKWALKRNWYFRNGILLADWLSLTEHTGNILLVTSEIDGINAQVIEHGIKKLGLSDTDESYIEKRKEKMVKLLNDVKKEMLSSDYDFFKDIYKLPKELKKEKELWDKEFEFEIYQRELYELEMMKAERSKRMKEYQMCKEELARRNMAARSRDLFA